MLFGPYTNCEVGMPSRHVMGVVRMQEKGNNSMAEMIAYCGLVCTSCPQYIATKNNDDIAREEIAKEIAEKFGLHYKPEEIDCDGCLSSSGRLIGFCNTCEVRKCGINQSVENCTACNDRPCDKLDTFHEFSPGAKASFEALLKTKEKQHNYGNKKA